MSLQVQVVDKGLSRFLAKALRLLDGQGKPINEAIGAALEQNANLRFDTKTDPAGNPWREWAPSTAKARAAEGRGTLLEYTGRLRDSLTHVADNDSVEVGFGVPYARYVDKVRPLLLDNGKLGKDDAEDAIAAAMTALQKQLNLRGA